MGLRVRIGFVCEAKLSYRFKIGPQNLSSPSFIAQWTRMATCKLLFPDQKRANLQGMKLEINYCEDGFYRPNCYGPFVSLSATTTVLLLYVLCTSCSSFEVRFFLQVTLAQKRSSERVKGSIFQTSHSSHPRIAQHLKTNMNASWQSL